MNLKELGTKYGIVVLDTETIEDLEKDLKVSQEVLQKWLVEMKDAMKQIQRYKQAVSITLAYANRIDVLEKVLKESDFQK